MLRAIAIDDEPLALKVIENFCSHFPEVSLEKTFTSPNEGLKYINKFPVDLAFVDIQMPSLTGIELVKAIKQETLVVFTTAYDNFALEGYNLNAIDYLLKPFTLERFSAAINKVSVFRKGNLGGGKNENAFITVRADYSLVKIELNAIRYIEGLDDYIKIYCGDTKPVVTRSTMKSILDVLPEDMFIRVHRSFIVPLNCILALKTKVLVLNGNIEIPIGQSFEENLVSKFKASS